MVRIVDLAFEAYAVGCIVYAVCSWISHPQAKKLENWLRPWYEPLLQQIRRVVRPILCKTTCIDVAPLVLLLGLAIARKVVLAILLLPY